MAEIGDYVISDYKITSVERRTTVGDGYYFTGNGFGKQPYDSGYRYNGSTQRCWYSKKDSPIATIKDLKIFSDAIIAGSPELYKPEVKEFIRKATEWIVARGV